MALHLDDSKMANVQVQPVSFSDMMNILLKEALAGERRHKFYLYNDRRKAYDELVAFNLVAGGFEFECGDYFWYYQAKEESFHETFYMAEIDEPELYRLSEDDDYENW